MLVQGGPANSGTKRVLRDKPREAWTCKCQETHPPYLVRCPRCRTKRDET